MGRVMLADGSLRFNADSRLRVRVLLLMSFEFPVCDGFGSCLDQGTANSALDRIEHLCLSNLRGRSHSSSIHALFFSLRAFTSCVERPLHQRRALHSVFYIIGTHLS